MIRSKYSKALRALSKKGVFSSAEGREAGIPPRMLAYFYEKGEIEKVWRGMYKIKNIDFDSAFEWEDLVLTALSIPNGVICLISALSYYDLTDEIMREFWIAVPHATTSPSRKNTRIIRMRTHSLGKTSVKIGSRKINIFDRERTIVDAFRLLDHEVAIKALKAYLSWAGGLKPDLRKLQDYARALKVDMNPYILALTT